MIDFFQAGCQAITSSSSFGICDNPTTKAYLGLDPNSTNEWIAIVNNEKNKAITFTAIDNCIDIRRENGEKESSCDCVLTYENNIDFVELKNVRQKWIQGGIDQLKQTIKVFRQAYPLDNFERRRAFLANKKHPQFKSSHKEEMQKFRNEFKVRLLIQNDIRI